MEDLIKRIEKVQVIFLPETHTGKEDHQFQLSVIKLMYDKNMKFVIAMEMFQQSFQKFLDEYVECSITEEEMLEKTEYKKRWGYDPALYRDIWRFAKERGIRLVAINLPTELLQRIRKEGLERVKDPLLPEPVVDMTEEERRSLTKIFESHPKVQERVFFDVQKAWDNGMALALARTLERYPDHKVVVLVGRGHAESLDRGIPRRLSLLKPGVRMTILERP